MRKCIFVILICCVLVSCAPRLDYDALVEENVKLKSDILNLTEQVLQLKDKLEEIKPEETVRVRIVGGFSGVVNSVVEDWMNGHSEQSGYRYYVTVTPYQLSPVLISVVSANPITINENVIYYFGLKTDDALLAINQPFEVSLKQAAQAHAPFPPHDYWFSTVKTPLGEEDSGVNSMQFYWEKIV